MSLTTPLNLDPTETSKKVYTREFMLGRSALPIYSTEPEYMKDFENLRVINSNADVPLNTQETVNDLEYIVFISLSI